MSSTIIFLRDVYVVFHRGNFGLHNLGIDMVVIVWKLSGLGMMGAESYLWTIGNNSSKESHPYDRYILEAITQIYSLCKIICTIVWICGAQILKLACDAEVHHGLIFPTSMES